MVTVAIDTNILAYAEDTNGPAMKKAALDLLEKLPPESTLIPVQALGELFNVLVRKAKRSRQRAQEAVLTWGDAFPLIDTSSPVILAALDLTTKHQFGWWDAVILSALERVKEGSLLADDKQKLVRVLTREMKDAARVLDFERAAILRDQIQSIKTK